MGILIFRAFGWGGTHPITALLRTDWNDEATEYRDRAVFQMPDCFCFYFFSRSELAPCPVKILTLVITTAIGTQCQASLGRV